VVDVPNHQQMGKTMLSIFEFFDINFELELQKWELISYEIHFHFVLLGYVQVSYDYVGWVVIYFQEVKGLSKGVQLTNNLKNKHTFIG
jgi:hypothetical protein